MNPDFIKRHAVPVIAFSSLMISCNGLFLRSIEAATPWQVIFSRQISFVGATLVVLLFLHRSKFFFLFLQAGWVGLLGGVLLSLANTCLILSISLTTVANTLFILSACPLITAVLAWVFLKERIESMTIIAILVSMGGIAMMLWEGFFQGFLIGNLIALMCALSFSGFVIFLRLGKDRDMMPASVIGGLLAALIGLIGSGFDYLVPPRDFAICFVWGAGVICLVHFLFVYGSRHLPGAEIMLLTLIEFTLGPLWVWLVFDERPGLMALLGGLLVLGAVFVRSLLLMRQATSPL
jgi:drug/metabolite transporter (DMT)-like permease